MVKLRNQSELIQMVCDGGENGVIGSRSVNGGVRSVRIREELKDICKLKGRSILGTRPEVLNGYSS
jgi:hypothetical protein